MQEVNYPDNNLHLCTAGHHCAGVHPWLKVQSARWLKFRSAPTAVMIKSLHHVSLPLLDAALREIHRVLVDRGHLYVSEPLYAGEFNEVMRLFHDEGTERAAAYSALQRACQCGAWDCLEEHVLDAELAFRDFDQFMDRMVHHSGLNVPPDVLPAVKARFERSMTTFGARFLRQVRINLLRKRIEAGLPSTVHPPALPGG